MKKIITILLALTMVFCFAACGSNDTGAEDVDAGLANPMTEVESLEALNAEFDCVMITPTVVSVSDEQFFKVAADPEFAQYNFKANGVDCTLRFAVAGMDTDISGYWKSDDSGETVFANSDSDTSYYECDEAKLARWFTIDGQYCFMANDNGEMDYNTFDSIIGEIKAEKPVNWNDDGSFERYKALENYYQDEVSQRAIASFSVDGDHGKVYINWGNGASETYEWIMDVAFDENDNLAYSSEKRNVYKADENGVSTEEALEDGGAGYFEVKDGKLYCTGVADETLRDCVFAPMDLSATASAE